MIDPYTLLEDHGYKPKWDGRIAEIELDSKPYRLTHKGEFFVGIKELLFHTIVCDVAKGGEPFSGYSYDWVIIPDPEDENRCVMWRDVYGHE